MNTGFYHCQKCGEIVTNPDRNTESDNGWITEHCPNCGAANYLDPIDAEFFCEFMLACESRIPNESYIEAARFYVEQLEYMADAAKSWENAHAMQVRENQRLREQLREQAA